MDKQVAVRQPFSAWHTQLIRVTAFCRPEGQPDTMQWWAGLVDSQPESEIRKSREGLTRYEGTLDKRKLILSIEPDRVDLVLGPPDEPAPDAIGLPAAGVAEESFRTAIALGKRLFRLVTFPPISRLAFAPIVFLPVSDKESGYRQLSEYLPFSIDASAAEFSYQINRPRLSNAAIAGLTINRLAKWQVLRLSSEIYRLSRNGTPPMPLGKTHDYYLCLLELDVNTDKDFSAILPPELLDELGRLAEEICDQGDIP